MRRRAFIGGLMGMLPLARASAQSGNRIYRIGSVHSAPADAPHHVAFFEGLAQTGFVPGRNLERDAAGYGLRQEQFAAHVAELVKARVDVLLCAGDLAIQQAQRLTATIPILGVTEDMLASGFVGSLSKRSFSDVRMTFPLAS